MEWSSNFEVGNNKIDMEHHVFFDLVQSVGDAEREGASRDKLRRILAEIAKYAEFHFISEENMMIDVGYPAFPDHHQHHQALLEGLQKLIVGFEAGRSEAGELANFLNQWFAQHTANEDLLLAKYIANGS